MAVGTGEEEMALLIVVVVAAAVTCKFLRGGTVEAGRGRGLLFFVVLGDERITEEVGRGDMGFGEMDIEGGPGPVPVPVSVPEKGGRGGGRRLTSSAGGRGICPVGFSRVTAVLPLALYVLRTVPTGVFLPRAGVVTAAFRFVDAGVCLWRVDVFRSGTSTVSSVRSGLAVPPRSGRRLGRSREKKLVTERERFRRFTASADAKGWARWRAGECLVSSERPRR